MDPWAYDDPEQAIIDLFESLPIQRVPLDQLHIRDDFQPRNLKGQAEWNKDQNEKSKAMYEQMVTDLKNGKEITNPIWVVVEDGQASPCNGHHRFFASKETNKPDVPCKVYDGPNALEIGKLAAVVGNNRGHSVPLHPKELREAAFEMVKNKPELSTRKIATLFRKRPSHSTIQNMREATMELGSRTDDLSWEDTKKLLTDRKTRGPDDDLEYQENIKRFLKQGARRFGKDRFWEVTRNQIEDRNANPIGDLMEEDRVTQLEEALEAERERRSIAERQLRKQSYADFIGKRRSPTEPLSDMVFIEHDDPAVFSICSDLVNASEVPIGVGAMLDEGEQVIYSLNIEVTRDSMLLSSPNVNLCPPWFIKDNLAPRCLLPLWERIYREKPTELNLRILRGLRLQYSVSNIQGMESRL